MFNWLFQMFVRYLIDNDAVIIYRNSKDFKEDVLKLLKDTSQETIEAIVKEELKESFKETFEGYRYVPGVFDRRQVSELFERTIEHKCDVALKSNNIEREIVKRDFEKYLKSEEFLDSIINRILRKQLTISNK